MKHKNGLWVFDTYWWVFSKTVARICCIIFFLLLPFYDIGASYGWIPPHGLFFDILSVIGGMWLGIWIVLFIIFFLVDFKSRSDASED